MEELFTKKKQSGSQKPGSYPFNLERLDEQASRKSELSLNANTGHGVFYT